MRIPVRRRFRKPSCQSLEVCNAVAACDATVVDTGYGCEQRRNRGASPASQHFRLRLPARIADKPASQSAPSGTPKPSCLAQTGLFLVLQGVNNVTPCGGVQQTLNIMFLDFEKAV